MCQQALKVSSPFLQWVIVEEILVSQRKFKLCTHEKVKSKARRLSSCTLAKTEIIYPKNVGALLTMNFT